jgi:hypothetical protein
MTEGVVPPDSFFEFLDARLHELDWTDYRLTQKAKLKSTSYISQLRKGKKIGYGLAAALAPAPPGLTPSRQGGRLLYRSKPIQTDCYVTLEGVASS